MEHTTSPHTEPNARGKERLMASEFHILLNGTMVVRTYSGTAKEQFAAYLAEFPFDSGANLRYCRDLAPQVPLVTFA